jgi:YD repeat-containing protein
MRLLLSALLLSCSLAPPAAACQFASAPHLALVPQASDRERAGLRGPVKTCTQERFYPDAESRPTALLVDTAHYDAAGRLLLHRIQAPHGDESLTTYTYNAVGRLLRVVHERTGVTRQESSYQYDSQGRLSGITPATTDDPDVTFEYDADGRKTRIERYPPRAPEPNVAVGWGATAHLLAAPPVFGGTLTVRHDHEDRPIEALVHDLDGRLIRRTERRYDDEGRWLGDTGIVEEPLAEMPVELTAQLDPQQKAFLARQIAALTGGPALSLAYDEHGRVREQRIRRMGRDSVTLFLYNQHGDVVAQRHQTVVDPETQHPEQEVRLSYRYDEHGNWIEQTTQHVDVSGEPLGNPVTFRRLLTYW